MAEMHYFMHIDSARDKTLSGGTNGVKGYRNYTIAHTPVSSIATYSNVS